MAPHGTILMATADTPALQYRRRKRRLAIHAVLFVIVNGFFVGQWLLVRDAPLEDADARALAPFWPAWLMLLWGVVLGIHGLYVWAWVSTSARECTPVRSICSDGTWPGSAGTSPRAS